MIKRIAAWSCLLLFSLIVAFGCGKKEEPVQPTSEPVSEPVTEASNQKSDATLEIARDDTLRDFLNDFDPYTDGGEDGSMEYDYRDTISVRRLMDCLFGQRCCVDYKIYPTPQPAVEGDVMRVPGEAFSWAAEHIFHVPVNDIADYKSASPAYADDAFSGTLEENENGVQWYYSDFTVLKAEKDDTYYYVHYRRNHDDPSVDGTKYQKEYFAILGKEKIDNGEYWTLYTHSSNNFNYVVPDEELTPDVVFEAEKEMHVNTETPVTMRMGPSTDYGAICSYNPGITVMAIGTKGEWVYVHYYDHYGWIRGDLLADGRK